MLLAVPVVLACSAMPSCQPISAPSRPLVRSSSPAAIVQVTQPDDVVTDPSGPLQLALQRVDIPPTASRSQNHSREAAIRTPLGGKAAKAALVLAGVVAGCYAGGYLGAAMDDHPDDGAAFLGMPIGAAIGGWAVWNLVK